MKLDNGTYKADVVLLPDRKEATKLALEVHFADGLLTANVADRDIKIGETTHKLSTLRTIFPGEGRAVLRSGDRTIGKITGLEGVPITLGGREVTLDLSTAQEIAPQLRVDEPVVTMEVVARRGGKELGRISRAVIVDDANKVYLADLHAFATKPGPWPLAVGNVGDETATPIKVNGTAYPKGLGLHANNPPATASSRLSKTANVFRATAAFADNNDGKVTGPTHFEVYGDGKLLWKSKVITTRGQTDNCLIDVTGVDVLELRTGHKGSHWGAHAVWLDPILVGPDPAAIRRATTKK
jgi:hypothetical protein